MMKASSMFLLSLFCFAANSQTLSNQDYKPPPPPPPPPSPPEPDAPPFNPPSPLPPLSNPSPQNFFNTPKSYPSPAPCGYPKPAIANWTSGTSFEFNWTAGTSFEFCTPYGFRRNLAWCLSNGGYLNTTSIPIDETADMIFTTTTKTFGYVGTVRIAVNANGTVTNATFVAAPPYQFKAAHLWISNQKPPLPLEKNVFLYNATSSYGFSIVNLLTQQTSPSPKLTNLTLNTTLPIYILAVVDVLQTQCFPFAPPPKPQQHLNTPISQPSPPTCGYPKPAVANWTDGTAYKYNCTNYGFRRNLAWCLSNGWYLNKSSIPFDENADIAFVTILKTFGFVGTVRITVDINGKVTNATFTSVLPYAYRGVHMWISNDPPPMPLEKDVFMYNATSPYGITSVDLVTQQTSPYPKLNKLVLDGNLPVYVLAEVDVLSTHCFPSAPPPVPSTFFNTPRHHSPPSPQSHHQHHPPSPSPKSPSPSPSPLPQSPSPSASPKPPSPPVCGYPKPTLANWTDGTLFNYSCPVPSSGRHLSWCLPHGKLLKTSAPFNQTAELAFVTTQSFSGFAGTVNIVVNSIGKVKKAVFQAATPYLFRAVHLWISNTPPPLPFEKDVFLYNVTNPYGIAYTDVVHNQTSHAPYLYKLVLNVSSPIYVLAEADVLKSSCFPNF